MDRATVIELADFINSEDEIDHGLINKLRDIQGKIYLLHSTEGGVSLGEGIDTEDIFSYIHNCCKESHTDINMVTLVWGNANSEQLYTDWCSHNNIKPQLTVITINRWCGVVHDFTTDYSKHYERNYKANKPLDKLFTFLSRARRQHRVDILNALCDYKLLDDIEWSWHGAFEESALRAELEHLVPKTIELKDVVPPSSAIFDPGAEFYNVFDTTYFDLVPETFYYNDKFKRDDYDWWNTIFITEKTWRCMYNKRPFIIAGNKGTLAHLHSLGFKTFPHIFDESYDDLSDQYRLEQILLQINNIDKVALHDKIFSKETNDILEHNKKVAEHLAGNESNLLHWIGNGVLDLTRD